MSKIPRLMPVDLAEQKKKLDIERGKVYVDTEGKPWRKTDRDTYVRISVERKPTNE